MNRPTFLLGFALVACAPTARLSSPRVLDVGRAQLTGGTTLQLVGAGPARFPVLQLGGGLRVGIAERLELGGGLRGFYTTIIAMLGADLDLKWQLHRAESEHEGAELSLVSNVAYHWVSGSGADAHQLSPSFAVLMALNLGGGDQFIAAPAVIDQISFSTGASTVHQPFVGTTLGYRWSIDETFSLLPELGMFFSPVGIEGNEGVRLLVVQVGAAFNL